MPPQDGKQPSETQEIVADAFDSRVTVIKADLSLEQLGVDEETYNMLQYEVDIIIHAAAQVTNKHKATLSGIIENVTKEICLNTLIAFMYTKYF